MFANFLSFSLPSLFLVYIYLQVCSPTFDTIFKCHLKQDNYLWYASLSDIFSVTQDNCRMEKKNTPNYMPILHSYPWHISKRDSVLLFYGKWIWVDICHMTCHCRQYVSMEMGFGMLSQWWKEFFPQFLCIIFHALFWHCVWRQRFSTYKCYMK